MEEQQHTLTKKERIAQKRAEKELRKSTQSKQSGQKKLIVAVVIAAVVVLVVWLIASSQGGGTVVDLTPDPAVGPAEATVVVKAYEDFECPACAAVHPVVTDIIEEYGDKIRFEYNDFPLPQHQYAITTAIAGQCVNEQSKFFEFAELVYDRQETWAALKSKSAVESTLITYVEELGLDAQVFQDCTIRQDIAASVDEDVSEARTLNVNSTPSFFVNGERVVTGPFSQTLRAAIDAALGE